MALAHGPTPDERDRMLRLTQALPTKAAKIRALGTAGYTRSQIAAFLGISYQHVRNVLTREEEAKEAVERRTPDDPEAESGEPELFGQMEMDENGRIQIPGHVIEHLHLRRGGIVPWRVEDDELVLMSPQAGFRRAHEILRAYDVPGETSWTDAFLRDRRAEWGEKNDDAGT
ncbi:MAG: hypothetical protein WD359_01275 [Dehalococcoidia bacterium]